MIRKILIRNFKLLEEFEWHPEAGVNIIVGDNASGKSTILEAIELAMTLHSYGIRARDALSPHWFNDDCVRSFFSDLAAEKSPSAPQISIEVFFCDNLSPDIEKLRGVNNSLKEDAPGLSLTISVENELLTEFYAVCAEFSADETIIPTEYYSITWKDFSGKPCMRRPDGVICSKVQTDIRNSVFKSNYHSRGLIESLLDDADVRAITSKQNSLRRSIDEEIMAKTIGKVSQDETLSNVGFQMDQGYKHDWRNSVTLGVESRPIQYEGHGSQICIKTKLSFETVSDGSVILLEEPESHLSHTTLLELISGIERVLGNQQLFITTHSAYVLNRFGLDRLALLYRGNNPCRITDLSKNTITYFQKLSGYDTLRIVLARKLVLVEGPSDEMIFNWGYYNRYGAYPAAEGIDVMDYGTRGKRALELSSRLERSRVAVLRDNDGEDPGHWIEDASDFISEDRQMFIGAPSDGFTLEPQMIHSNADKLDDLAQIIGCSNSDESRLEQYMKDHKTDWALRIATSDSSAKLQCPEYMYRAMEFIRDAK